MKPENWDKLPAHTKRRIADDLVNSLRGNYIVSQALALAIQSLKAVPKPRQEVSNIQDMEMLREAKFSMPIHIEGKGLV